MPDLDSPEGRPSTPGADPAQSTPPAASSRGWQVVLAFAAVYLIWGSTYLAIRFAIASIPPFAMAGVRFVVAGTLLFAWARLRGAALPDRGQLRDATVVGLLLLTGGNGGLVWAQQWVPSGLAAVLVATVPLWMVVLEALRPGGERPGAITWLGLAGGLAGVAVLSGGRGLAGGGREALLGGLVVVVASLSWAAGSIRARSARLPRAPRMATAMQMLGGGTGLLIAATVSGEWGRFDPASVTLRSVVALVYLIVFGALVAYGAYIWLLQVTTPARVATYAYVNPVVALVLGWALADEPVGPRTLVGAGVVLASVILLGRRRR